jgi:hypothetical protein
VRRRRSEPSTSCAVCRAGLVDVIATDGTDGKACPACVELLELPELGVLLVVPHKRGADEAPSCPRCTKPLGASVCASCGYPGAGLTADQARRQRARARRVAARALRA